MSEKDMNKMEPNQSSSPPDAAAKHCFAAACRRLLADWDAHLFCPLCRSCSASGASCQICTDWTPEMRQKAQDWVKPKIKEEPKDHGYDYVAISDDDGDDDDCILIESPPVDTAWIKKEPQELPKLKVFSDPDEVIIILSDDEESDHGEESALGNSGEKASPSSPKDPQSTSMTSKPSDQEGLLVEPVESPTLMEKVEQISENVARAVVKDPKQISEDKPTTPIAAAAGAEESSVKATVDEVFETIPENNQSADPQSASISSKPCDQEVPLVKPVESLTVIREVEQISENVARAVIEDPKQIPEDEPNTPVAATGAEESSVKATADEFLGKIPENKQSADSDDADDPDRVTSSAGIHLDDAEFSLSPLSETGKEVEEEDLEDSTENSKEGGNLHDETDSVRDEANPGREEGASPEPPFIKDYDSDGWELASEDEADQAEAAAGQGVNKEGSTHSEEDIIDNESHLASSATDPSAIELVVPPPAPSSPPRPLKIFVAEAIPGLGVNMDLTMPTVSELDHPGEGSQVPPIKDDQSSRSGSPLEAKDAMEMMDSSDRNLPDVVSERKQEVGPEVIFNCHQCFESFKDKDSLARHLDHHPQVTRIMCQYCNLSFQKQRNLTSHLHRCYRRKKSLTSKGKSGDQKDLYDRIKLKEGNRERESSSTEHLCQICIKSFQNSRALQTHIQFAHFKSSRQSKVIKTESKCESPRKKHMSCPICHKKYQRTGRLTTHLYNRHKKRLGDFPSLKLQVTSWPKKFGEKREMESRAPRKNHKNLQDILKVESKPSEDSSSSWRTNKALQELLWLCPLCYRNFSRKFGILQHLKKEHRNQYDSIESKLKMVPKEKAIRLAHYCRTCHKYFRSAANYKRHASQSSGKLCEKRFKCNTCERVFVGKVECANHIQEHFGRYACRKAVCRKVFGNEKSRDLHEQSHKDSKKKESPKQQSRGSSESGSQVALPVRSKRPGRGRPSGSKSSVRSSSQTTEGDEVPRKKAKLSSSFKCKTCRKKFDREYLLVKHQLEHSNQDPWHCYICFKIFYLDRSMVNHMETYHEGVLYCKKCYCILARERTGNRLCVDCDKKGRSTSLKCGLCKTEFDSAPSLAQHILTHDHEDNPAAPEKKSESPTDISSKDERSKAVSLSDIVPKRPGRPLGITKTSVSSSSIKSSASSSSIKSSVSSSGIKSSVSSSSIKSSASSSSIKSSVSSSGIKSSVSSSSKTTVEIIRCSICKSEFKTICLLVEHVMRHEDDRVRRNVQYRCSLCNKICENVAAFALHILEHDTDKRSADHERLRATLSPGNELRRITRSCPQVVPDEPLVLNLPRSAHKSHKAMPKSPKKDPGASTDTASAKKKPFSSKSSQSKSSSKEYVNVCMKCGETGISSDDLTKHARIHFTSNSEYCCNGCQKRFPNVDDIEMHLAMAHPKVHSYTVAKSAYQCLYCGMDFHNIMEARKHVLSTNASCMLECPVCNQEYGRQGDLMVHMINVHQQYLECDKCLAQFTRPIDLQNHLTQHAC